MAIETGLRTLLLAESTITTLAPAQTIKGQSYNAIFCEHPVQDFLPPFVLISLIDFDPMKYLSTTSGMETTEIDIDCYERTYVRAIALGKAVSDYLKDYNGAAGASDTINAVFWEGKRYDKIFDADGRDVRQHIISLNFRIQHTAS